MLNEASGGSRLEQTTAAVPQEASLDDADPGTSGQHANVGAAEEDVPQLRARLLEALQQVEKLRGRSESFQNLEAAAQAAQAAGVPSKVPPPLAGSAAAASGELLLWQMHQASQGLAHILELADGKHTCCRCTAAVEACVAGWPASLCHGLLYA